MKLARVKKIPVRFLKSASRLEECPPPTLPEIAVLGRSNSGKSSLLNAIFGRKMAKTSSTPGKTTLLNFFEYPESHRLVDIPGYGYAARGQRQVNAWKRMIENYLSCRENLVGTLLIMDIRREWQDEEEQLVSWLEKLNVPCAVVLTKSDKVNRTQRERRLKERRQIVPKELLFVTTTSKVSSFAPVEEYMWEHWVNSDESEEADEEAES